MSDSYVMRCIGDNASIPVIRATYNQTYSWNIPGTPPFFISRSIGHIGGNNTFGGHNNSFSGIYVGLDRPGSDLRCDNPANVTGNLYNFTIEPFGWLQRDSGYSERNHTEGLLIVGDSIVFTAISMASGPMANPMYAVSSNYSIVNTTQDTNGGPASLKSKSLVGMLLVTALVSLVSF